MIQAWDRPAPEAASPSRVNAVGLGLPALQALLEQLGEPRWRAAQLFEGLYHHRWTDWGRFTMFSKALRARLAASADLAWPEIVQSQASEDGATKHAFQLADRRQVEGVHMPYEGRVTLCLSSQVGCAMGCTFCATGQMGILRNLTAAEIVGQVVAMLNHHGHPEGVPVNLVFMGMGEPLHNLEHLMAAFALLTDPKGLAIPPRRITVSTSGLVTGIERLAAFPRRPRLAVSLNATTDEHRSRIMPVNRVWNLEALAQALGRFPLQPGERITLEYVLLKGVTDSPEDGRRLSAFARRFPSKINLIPFNPHEGGAGAEPHGTEGSALGVRAREGTHVGGAGAEPHGTKGSALGVRAREGTHVGGAGAEPHGTGGSALGARAREGTRVGSGFEPPDEARVGALCRQLVDAGLTVSVRRSRGQDVAGACGQLVRDLRLGGQGSRIGD